VRLEDPTNGTLFAQCPLDNNRPELSVEPVSDSSRYFVIRVDDGSGRRAFLGMGFIERPDAFEFNVTLQDHVKRLKHEREAVAAAAAPAPPAQDFSLKGNISIGVPGSGGGVQRSRPPPAPSAAGSAPTFLAPPPPGSGGARRPVASAASQVAAAPASTADPFAGTCAFGGASDPFGAGSFGSAPANDPFAATFAATPATTPAEVSVLGEGFNGAPAAADGSWVAFGEGSGVGFGDGFGSFGGGFDGGFGGGSGGGSGDGK